jgi:hypothetical protein
MPRGISLNLTSSHEYEQGGRGVKEAINRRRQHKSARAPGCWCWRCLVSVSKASENIASSFVSPWVSLVALFATYN